MKKNVIKGLTAGLILSAALVSCNDNNGSAEYPGFTKIEDGLFIKYESRVEGERQVAFGDILTMDLSYGTKDSILMNTKDNGNPFRLQVDSGSFTGDIMKAFSQLRNGDSATVITGAYDFFTKTVGAQMPDFIDSAEALYFNIKLNTVESQEEAKKKAEEENAQAALKEQEELAAYIQENGITVEPTQSGLYYISTQAGTGKAAEAGKKVKVHYTGKFLNGQVFDSSVERGEPFEFNLGLGQVIRGWDEGIALMKEGEKATLIIPSSIAYGPQQNGPIPGFSTLVFDVELIEVSEAAE
jgi:FKBP-type peptidyl-prolyl cis-trans isomerase